MTQGAARSPATGEGVCGRVVGEAEQLGLGAQVGRFIKTTLPILKPVYSHGLLAKGVNFSGGFRKCKGRLRDKGARRRTGYGLPRLLRCRRCATTAWVFRPMDSVSKPLRAAGTRELPAPSTVPAARMLRGKRIMGLNPHAGVAYYLQQILSADPAMKPFFIGIALLEKHRK